MGGDETGDESDRSVNDLGRLRDMTLISAPYRTAVRPDLSYFRIVSLGVLVASPEAHKGNIYKSEIWIHIGIYM